MRAGQASARFTRAAIVVAGIVASLPSAAHGLDGVTVTSISPAAIGQGVTRTVVVNGSGFALGASASISGSGATAKTTTFVSSSQVKVKIAVSASASPGARSLTVANLDGSSGTCVACFVVNPAPRITSVSPASVGAGAVKLPLAIVGTGFQPGVKVTAPQKVTFKVTAVTSTRIDVLASANAAAPLGPRTLRVKNPDLGLGRCACLTVTPPPAVTLAAPGQVVRGTNTVVSLTGTGFQAGTAASASGTGVTVVSVTFLDSTRIDLALTVAQDASLGTRTLTITNVDGGRTQSGVTVVDLALVYGDSLTWESAWSIGDGFAAEPTWTHKVHSFPGTAPCLWREWLPVDLEAYHPATVALTTAAGAYTGAFPCMVDEAGEPLTRGTPEFYAKYRADLDAIFSTVTGSGARMVFVIAPPMLDPVRDAAITQIAAIATELAVLYEGGGGVKGLRRR